MAVVVKMPQLGESIVEGTVARWLKAPGDAVAKFEPLLEISTDKIDTEVPAPAAGVLLDIVAPEGKTVRVGSTLAHIGEAGEKVPTAQGSTPTSTRPPVPVATPVPAPPAPPMSPPTQEPTKPSGHEFISPVVARIASEHAIDLSQVAGTGAGGRVTKKDVLAYIETGDRRPETRDQKSETRDQRPETRDQRSEVRDRRPEESAPVSGLRSPVSNLQSPVSITQDEVLQPLTAMRRAIAQHMVQSKQTSPHVTTIFEVDMTAVVQHREQQKRAFAEKGINLTYTAYFVAATAKALRAVPTVNSRFTDEGIITHRRIHIGVAVALAEGLIVPVIRDADEKNLQGLARSVNELAEQARTGKLSADAVKGGTFTITNHGVGGSLVGAPIINQPQAGILGIGAIVKRPVVRSATNSLLPSADDAIVIRPMCYLSFSFDHRLLDGARADEFLTVVKETLENWRDH
ncbi:MAG: dihydrolipoamide acetyltransferase family protein [Caldilineaceae bacterium]